MRIAFLFLLALLIAGCAKPPPPVPMALPTDLSLRTIRVVEARAHPVYARWTKAPPITQLLEIEFSSGADFVGYAAQENLPFVRGALALCPQPDVPIRPLTPFMGHVFWADYAVDGAWGDDPAQAELRASHVRAEPYLYRSFVEIAANSDVNATPARAAYDLLRSPNGLCLSVIFSDMRATRNTNTVFIPKDTLVAAFLAGDLRPGTDYLGPKLPEPPRASRRKVTSRR